MIALTDCVHYFAVAVAVDADAGFCVACFGVYVSVVLHHYLLPRHDGFATLSLNWHSVWLLASPVLTFLLDNCEQEAVLLLPPVCFVHVCTAQYPCEMVFHKVLRGFQFGAVFLQYWVFLLLVYRLSVLSRQSQPSV